MLPVSEDTDDDSGGEFFVFRALLDFWVNKLSDEISNTVDGKHQQHAWVVPETSQPGHSDSSQSSLTFYI